MSEARPDRRALLVGALAAAVAAGCQASGPGLVSPGSPFIATPEAIATAMLTLAGTTSGDVVYDLGSGDGRLVIGAAHDHGARGVGVELDPALVQASREAAARAGVADRVRFLWADIFATDVSEATVVTLYLGADLNRRVRPKLLRELRPGSRVVSHRFDMAEWRPDRTVDVQGRALHLWVIPAAVEGRWRMPGGPSLELSQRYQDLTGRLDVGGDPIDVQGGMAGSRMSVGGSGWRVDAAVEGDDAVGQVTAPAGVAIDWRAARRSS